QATLYLTHAWSRSLWGGTNYNPQSRFISEIPDDLIHVLREAESPRKRGWASDRRQSPIEPRVVAQVNRGDRVFHEAFGAGEIIEVNGTGVDTEVVVRFDDEGEKRLMAAYANLQKA
ncbi:MAG: ATP-dependent DNA helicase PcrA, partial [Actinobacteria bacterium]|nr:ATP-dependent DNA helicase PcrA [Actinomycetota bacterium]